MLVKIQKTWKEKRGKIILISYTFLTTIARRSHEADKASGFNEGGRIVDKLIAELILDKILQEATRNRSAYEKADIVELILSEEKTTVSFRQQQFSPPSKLLEQIIQEILNALPLLSDSLFALHWTISGSFACLELGLQRWRKGMKTEVETPLPSDLLDYFRSVCNELEGIARRSEQDAQDRASTLVEKLVATLTKTMKESVA